MTNEEIYRQVELGYLIEDAKRQYESFKDINPVSYKRELTDSDYEILAERFIYSKDCNVPDNETWAYIINEYMRQEIGIKTLTNVVNSQSTYIIPVEWSVYSTVVVKGASNLKEAIDTVQEYIDDIPLSSSPEYIDGSYKISGDTDEDFINAQSYVPSDTEIHIDENGKITIW